MENKQVIRLENINMSIAELSQFLDLLAKNGHTPNEKQSLKNGFKKAEKITVIKNQ